VRVEGRAFQGALKSYGFTGSDGEPLTLDGIVGPDTIYATQRFDEWVEFSEGGSELWGDYTIVPSADRRSVDIQPDSAARRFQTRGSTYLAEYPDEVVFPRDRTATPSSSETLAPPAPRAALAMPFWRSSNPWAWLLSGFGLIGLGFGTFKLGVYLRRRT
jgi:hypothetical protein